MEPISPIKPETIFPVGLSQEEKTPAAPGFADMFKSALNQVNDLQINSDKLATDLALGQANNLHEVMIAAEKASIALQLTAEIRNRAIEAYQEIMRMPV